MLEQQKIIESVRALAKRTPEIVSVLIYGSFTEGLGDRYSDVEFYIYVQDELENKFRLEQWIKQVAPFHLHLCNEYGTEVFIFDSLIRGEFHVCPVNRIGDIAAWKNAIYIPNPESMCLYDPTGILAEHLRDLNGSDHRRLAEDRLPSVWGCLLNNLLYGVNVLKRGELLRSNEILGLVVTDLIRLERFKSGRTEHFVNARRCAENELDEDVYNDMKACTVQAVPDKLTDAYLHAVKLAGIHGCELGLPSQVEIIDHLSCLLNPKSVIANHVPAPDENP